ncbi:unnamed protein product [Clonostachys rosea f. rosea IK726]|uniref:Uncharacterized protein n=1 Tax=Clonostachys rosea f. rosea IK726 TaxID=1349383 RepID=A0ACA9UCN7_BIOOC|nr:unnamed protein product [Clonostachys rosea f. rosea IK726]
MSCYSKKRNDPPPYQQHPTTYQQAQLDDFAPPTGPPPVWGGWGWGGAHNLSVSASGRPQGPGSYQRPVSSHYPSQSYDNALQPQVLNYNNGHIAPYGTSPQPSALNQQHLQQRPNSASSWHSQSNPRPTSLSMIFPASMSTWWNSDSNMGTFVEFGMEPKGEPLFSGKLSMSSEKITLRRDKFKRNGEHLGEVKMKGSTGTKYLIKLPDCHEAEYNGSFQFPYRGSMESWSWASTSKSIGDKLTDKLNQKLTGKEKSLQLVGKLSGIVAATVLAEEDPMSSMSLTSSKKHIGRFDFKGPVLSGELGNDFSTLAIMAFLRTKHEEAEKQIVKAIFKGVGGI